MRLSRPTRYILAGALLAVCTVLPLSSLQAQIVRPEDVVKIKPALPKTGFNPGETFHAAIVLDILEGYHLNSHGTKDPTAIATELKLPRESKVSWPYISWPEDQVKPGVEVSGLVGDYYYTRVIIRLVGRLPKELEPGEIKLPMKLYYQTCTEELCLMPVDKSFEFAIPVVAPGTEVKNINEDIFGKPGGK